MTACCNSWRPFGRETYGLFSKSTCIQLFDCYPGFFFPGAATIFILNLPSKILVSHTYLSQVAAQLLSAGMIIHAHTILPNSVSSVLVQPWFVVLVIALAVERLSGLALGVATERDWVVLVVYLFFLFLLGNFL